MTATKKLSENILSQVSGGTATETADDSRFLNVLLQGKPGQCDRYGTFRIRIQDHEVEIERAWKAAGVDATISSGDLLFEGFPNKYKVNGITVTQEQARQHAMKVIGRQLKVSDWNW